MSIPIATDRQRAIENVEIAVLSDYKKLFGTVVQVSAICGYRGHDSVDLNLDPPAQVRIDSTSNQSLNRWIDDWCDPVYEVTLVAPHPQLRDVRSLWIHGTSRHINGSSTEASDLVASA